MFAKLASHYGIAAPTVAYSDATQDAAEPRIVRALAAGKRVALVSDAGMPLISDPGYRLVRAALAARPCRDLGARRLVPSPWRWRCRACRPTAFLRRLPAGQGERAPPRHRRRRRCAGHPGVFEAPHRLAASLVTLAELLGPRPAAIARELTKLFEEVRRAPLTELAEHYARHPDVKGEIVVVIGPPGEAEAPAAETLDEALRAAMAGASVKDAAAEVAARCGLQAPRCLCPRARELRREAAS